MKKRVCVFLLAMMLVLLMIPSSAFASGKMTVKWFDVGAGDSMFVKFPNGRTVLIDGGLASQGSKVASKLKKMGVKKLTYVISTHPDADHVGGLATIFKKFQVKNFYYPRDVKYSTKTAKGVIRLAKKEKHCHLRNPKPGKKLKGGNGAYLQFVQSKKDYTDSNEDSVASFINYGKLQILTMGDCENGAEEAVTKKNVDILQLPHHGSKYSSSAKMFKRFDPEKIIVSTDGHKYGHPNKEVFRRGKKYDKNIKVWRTDKKGDITVTATKSKFKFSCSGVAIGKYTSGKDSSNTGKKPKGNVYITKTGTKYHSRKSCRGLANARAIYSVPLATAKSKHLTKCSLCW